jgi:hypothetical protein
MMLCPQPFIPTSVFHFLPLILRQQLLDRGDFILHRLRLVGARPDTDVALDPHDALLVQHRVRLADERHDVGPGSFLCGQRERCV